MTKIVSTKTNAIFLAIVLITGTITALSSSSIIEAEAQAPPYYGMDNRYNNYGTTEYPDNNNYYNSYESTSDYVMDNNYRNLYGNDNYDQSQYPSYGKDNSYYKSQGIQGIQGEQDPPGITQLNCTKLHQKTLVKTVTPGSGEPLLNAQVLCEEDDIAITDHSNTLMRDS